MKSQSSKPLPLHANLKKQQELNPGYVTDEIGNSEISPEEHVVCWKEKTGKTGGGVFIAVNTTYVSSEVKTNNIYYLIFVKIQLKYTFYRPNWTDDEYI